MTRSMRLPAGRATVALAAMVVALLILSACTLVHRLDPDVPRSEEVDHAADQTARRVGDQLGTMLTGQERALPSRLDECRGGQYNYKIKDPHQWVCTYSEGALVAGGEFESGVRRQEQAILAAGCEAHVNETQNLTEDADWLIERYWRQRPEQNSAEDMPQLRYLCGEGMRAQVEFTDPTTEQRSFFGYGNCASQELDDLVQRLCEKPSEDEVVSLLADRTDQVMMYVSVAQEYHQEPW